MVRRKLNSIGMRTDQDTATTPREVNHDGVEVTLVDACIGNGRHHGASAHESVEHDPVGGDGGCKWLQPLSYRIVDGHRDTARLYRLYQSGVGKWSSSSSSSVDKMRAPRASCTVRDVAKPRGSLLSGMNFRVISPRFSQDFPAPTHSRSHL